VLETCTQKVRAKLPALVTVTGEINTPRYPKPINIMKALKKPRFVWNAEDLGADRTRTGIPGSPSSTKEVLEPPKRNADTRYFSGSAEEIAAQLADMLHDEHLI
jgi:electron transfer flavoprotein beta subunit